MKKFLALVCTLCLLLTALPLTALAADVLGFFGYSVARPEVLKRRMDALTK